MSRRRALEIGSIIVFAVGVLYDVGLQDLMRPYAAQGIYFHPWSSEDMMQTVSIRDLRLAPLQSLLNIHIQPPGFDLIRALLVQFWPNLDDQAALQHVDSALYLLWAVVFGFMGVVVFRWVSRQCGVAVAALSSLGLFLHPASILFATYLDSTLLSAFLVLFAYYLLWKIKNGYAVPILLFCATVLSLFFTRSIFQLPAIILFAICLYLMKLPSRQLITFILVTGIVSSLYIAKQRYQFGILSTSSFAGLNLANSIGVGMGAANYAQYLGDPAHTTAVDPEMADVLTSKTKTGGQTNFNNIDYLWLNNYLLGRYEKRLLNTSIPALAQLYLDNAAIYFRPSSTYSSGHVIVERLPWLDLFNRIFSSPVLPILLLLAMIAWCLGVIKSRAYGKGLGILLPGLFVFVVSIASDKGENMRFKFFLEPVMFVFLVSQFYLAARRAYARVFRKVAAA